LDAYPQGGEHLLALACGALLGRFSKEALKAPQPIADAAAKEGCRGRTEGLTAF
jgi:hypothetical protein